MIIAEIAERDGEIHMAKSCPLHGNFDTVIWQDDADSYESWLNAGGISFEDYPDSEEKAESFLGKLNFSSPALAQSSASALMTTGCCNINCPVCFTRTEQDKNWEPPLNELENLIDYYRAQAGEGAILELCGGEPTTRNDLSQIASYAAGAGFDYIQLNTNGLRLSQNAGYCRMLKNSGITTVYLGFDGVTEGPYLTKYGRPMLEIKKKAVKNCAIAGLAVVLVTCIIPGENDDQLGAIINFAKSNIPAVKGVYFQPVSFFGTYDCDMLKRITVPEVLRKIEEQTDGEIEASCFSPGAYEHAQCAFNGNFILYRSRELIPITKFRVRKYDSEGYIGIRKAVRKTWMPGDGNTLTIGGMGFQDAWNIDLFRISRCSVQIIGRDHQMMPLCSKYLTDDMNRKLNKGIN